MPQHSGARDVDDSGEARRPAARRTMLEPYGEVFRDVLERWSELICDGGLEVRLARFGEFPAAGDVRRAVR